MGNGLDRKTIELKTYCSAGSPTLCWDIAFHGSLPIIYIYFKRNSDLQFVFFFLQTASGNKIK
jgi:hypothetical protein